VAGMGEYGLVEAAALVLPRKVPSLQLLLVILWTDSVDVHQDGAIPIFRRKLRRSRLHCLRPKKKRRQPTQAEVGTRFGGIVQEMVATARTGRFLWSPETERA